MAKPINKHREPSKTLRCKFCNQSNGFSKNGAIYCSGCGYCMTTRKYTVDDINPTFKMPFGTYQGKHFDEIPREYLDETRKMLGEGTLLYDKIVLYLAVTRFL